MAGVRQEAKARVLGLLGPDLRQDGHPGLGICTGLPHQQFTRGHGSAEAIPDIPGSLLSWAQRR